MAERKSGPVKPPVIDLTARPASGDEAHASPGPTEPLKPDEAVKGVDQPKTVDTLQPVQLPKPADAPKPAEGAKPADLSKPMDPPKADRPATQPGPEKIAEKKEPPKEAAKLAAGPAPKAAGTTATRIRVSPWPAAFAAGVGGAIVAVAVCYGLASVGIWPVGGQLPDAALTARLDQSDKAVADLDARLGNLQNDTADRIGTLANSVKGIEDNIGKLQSASGPDLAPLQDQLKTLSTRLDAVASGASSADAGALAANVASLQQSSASADQRFTTLDGQLRDLRGAVDGLKSQLDSAKAVIDQAAAAPSKQAIASALQLPLLISALEADFAAGRPYDADLAALTKALPEAHVPSSVSGAAASGLPAPGELAAAFETKMPDMIAALPPSTDNSFTGQLGDWVRNVFAFRRQAPESGDSPEARLSQLEAAVNRHDFVGAVKLLDELPAPVRDAAGEVAGQVRAAADAQDFIGGLRQTALAPAGGAAQ